ncbi:MAG TPA: hypothetical protein VGZ22_29585, partial [Isosphaeraceae bacterium]|nr:hypothetical protein [Isosphaeraceae bacterium]
AEREEAEGQIANDPHLATSLDRMRRRLDLLLDDGDPIEPPHDLSKRTLNFVASYRPRRAILEFVPVTVPFRWADVAVAAGIFLAGLVTLLPAVHRSRLQTDQTVCAFNLGQLGRGLTNYAAIHGVYPYPSPDSPIPYAGTFKVMLNDAGQLWDPKMLDCPSNGKKRQATPLPDYETLCDLQDKDPPQFRSLLTSDYAYHLGYKRPSGEPGPIPVRLSSRIPLLADRPEHDDSGHIYDGNSPNHGGSGQNVLFNDGHVAFFRSRLLGPEKDDIFLNADLRPEPGVGPHDAVLAPGAFPFFDGRLQIEP